MDARWSERSGGCGFPDPYNGVEPDGSQVHLPSGTQVCQRSPQVQSWRWTAGAAGGKFHHQGPKRTDSCAVSRPFPIRWRLEFWRRLMQHGQRLSAIPRQTDAKFVPSMTSRHHATCRCRTPFRAAKHLPHICLLPSTFNTENWRTLSGMWHTWFAVVHL